MKLQGGIPFELRSLPFPTFATISNVYLPSFHNFITGDFWFLPPLPTRRLSMAFGIHHGGWKLEGSCQPQSTLSGSNEWWWWKPGRCDPQNGWMSLWTEVRMDQWWSDLISVISVISTQGILTTLHAGEIKKAIDPNFRPRTSKEGTKISPRKAGTFGWMIFRTSPGGICIRSLEGEIMINTPMTIWEVDLDIPIGVWDVWCIFRGDWHDHV